VRTTVAAAVLAVGLSAGASGCTGCPTALLQGVLVADGAGGMAVRTDAGAIEPVRWPGDIHVRTDDGRAVLTNFFGAVVGREGEYIRVGGGEDPDGPGFAACGPIGVSPSGPPTQ
jgi:hypothetical protein